jgi:uncharacterized membrane protein
MKFILLFLFIVSCAKPSQLVFSVKENPLPLVTEELKQSISYEEVQSKVFASKCLSCHDGNAKLQLDTYEKAVANLDKIKRTVFFNKTMPRLPVTALDKGELTLLAAWIKAGGPNGSLNGTNGPADHEPILEPKFESLKKLVLDRKCLICHSDGGNAARLPLVTKEDYLNSQAEVVIPGNPDDSGLMIVIEERARKFMPPTSSGFNPVSDEQKAVIREWILKGAP